MKRRTLRKYIIERKLELYEIIDSIKSDMLNDNFTEEDERELAVAEAQLDMLNDIAEICAERNRY